MKRYYKMFVFDVWGNDEDGYEVNDRQENGYLIIMDDEAKRDNLIKALKKVGFLNNNLRYSKFDEDGDCDYSLFYNYNSIPLFELESMTEDESIEYMNHHWFTRFPMKRETIVVRV